MFAKCWFPKAVEIRVLPGARLLANSFLTSPLFLNLFPKIVPSLTASAYFFEVEEDSGKGQKQVRNRSETPKRQHLPSIHPSIHPPHLLSLLLLLLLLLLLRLLLLLLLLLLILLLLILLVLVLVLVFRVLVIILLWLLLTVFLVWLPVLIFWSWRRFRERSETGQKHQKGSTCLASISYHCYFYFYFYYYYCYYYYYSYYYYYIITTTLLLLHYYYYITTTTTTSTSTSTSSTSTSSTSTSISSTSNHFTLTITNSVSRLAARAYFLKLKKTPGKVRNRSETPKRQHLPSIQPFTFVFLQASSWR